MKILIIDDHDILHFAIQHLIAMNWPDAQFTSVWEGTSAIARCSEQTFDLILLDLSMPSVADGFNVLLKLRKLQSAAKIVILTAHEEKKYQHLSYEYGADGFLLKVQLKTQLVDQLKKIINHQKIFIDQVYIPQVFDKEKATWKEIITSREKEVLVLTVRGFTQKEIAEVLGISVKTVNNHRTHIMEKLNSGKHSDWFNFAIQHHLVEL